jgi:hypothetical protein
VDFNFRKKPTPPTEESTERSDLQAEVVQSVPVKQPTDEAAGTEHLQANPIHENRQPGTEAEMDKILEDVNQKVKSAAAEVKPKKSWLAFLKKRPAASKMVTDTEPAPQSKPRRSLPLIITAVAILVGLALSAAAYFAFSEEPSQPANVSTVRDPESANTSVVPEDIDNLNADLQSEIDSLNSAQDFDSAALSDPTLGL